MNDRDLSLLKIVLKFSRELEENIAKHNLDYDKFVSDKMYTNSIAMSVFQVAEYVGKVSNETKIKYSNIRWRPISGLRNRIAHGYDGIDFEYIWLAATESILELKIQLEKILKAFGEK